MSPPSGFNSKKLRDRVRCYYKTHVQNSKKRLITLLKNPTRPRNREVLIRVVDEVRDRAAREVGAGKKIGTDGKAALRRLEATERSLYESRGAYFPSVATPESQEFLATATPSLPVPSSHSSNGIESWNQEPHAAPTAPPSPRRVSMGPSHYNESVPSRNDQNSEAPFASPCKPEHAAMLQSIRQVSVQFD